MYSRLKSAGSSSSGKRAGRGGAGVLIGVAEASDIEEAVIGDESFAALEEDVARLEVLVHDALGVQIAHSLHSTCIHFIRVKILYCIRTTVV